MHPEIEDYADNAEPQKARTDLSCTARSQERVGRESGMKRAKAGMSFDCTEGRSDKSLGTRNSPILDLLLVHQTGSVTILDGCDQSRYNHHMLL